MTRLFSSFVASHPRRWWLLAVFAGTGGMGISLAGCKKQEMENPLLLPPVVEVTPVTQSDVPIFQEWIATLDGSNNADIRARVSGYILTQDYADGRFVKKGDLLFAIDPRPFEAALAEAEASLAQAEAEQLRAELDAEKYVKTFASGAASEKDRDNAVQRNEAAKAKVKAEQAALEQAKLNLEYTKIVAPLDGIISIATRNIGDLVGPGDPTPLATLSTLNPIRVFFQVSEQTYLKASARFSGKEDVEVGRAMPVQMILADGSVYPHEGKFVAVDREVHGTTGTIRVAAEFPNPGNVLRPGQFARVRLAVQLIKDAMLVPQKAVEELQGSHQVATVDEENKVTIRLVKTGPRYGAQWVIKEGLQPGEQVVVEGMQKVAQGKVVKPQPYGQEKAGEAAKDGAGAEESGKNGETTGAGK